MEAASVCEESSMNKIIWKELNELVRCVFATMLRVCVLNSDDVEKKPLYDNIKLANEIAKVYRKFPAKIYRLLKICVCVLGVHTLIVLKRTKKDNIFRIFHFRHSISVLCTARAGCGW